ncbi:alpha-glucosidase [Tahibacter harae]|uniref:Alpha-glucosidase n=1 Tax=Tahibacter harae TaxID=2963937 RepID=A0ABT1QT87_9GAMM|nr:alpha-glucosidase [Tahibacter harae]MCQ4165508.1 alpha-glucosidase [Tahibacter harae]
MSRRLAAVLLCALAAAGPACAESTSLQCNASGIDRSGTPQALQDFDAAGNQRYNPLFDAGAWHGFLLPGDAAGEGGFAGPLVVAEEYAVFLAQGLDRLELRDAAGQRIDLAAGKTERCAAPGRLQLRYRLPTLELDLELRFTGARSAAVRTRLHNTGTQALQLTPSWHGALLQRFSTRSGETVQARYPQWRPRWSASPGGVQLALEGVSDPAALRFGIGAAYRIARSEAAETTVEGQVYVATGTPWQIAPGAAHTVWTVHSYYLAGDKAEDLAPAAAAAAFDASAQRWQRYLGAIGRKVAPGERPIAIKAVETLIGNWRAPAGALRHDVIVPSTTARWFNGAWSWDSWKHAAGVALVDPALARNSVLALFDYQIGADDPLRPQDSGMIGDNVFFRRSAERGEDGYNWNERNSKPALATWAVSEIERQASDPAWLQRMYPRLLAYHRWWYRNRDSDRDGLVEYGATRHPAHEDEHGRLRFSVLQAAQAPDPACTPGEAAQSYDCAGYDLYRRLLQGRPGLQLQVPVIEAAAWESGMDNAARFFPGDAQGLPTAVLENRDAQGRLLGWSINQVSVDQNSFLAQEKVLLAGIARRIGLTDDAAVLEQEARQLGERIRRCFYDAQTGYFYDRALPLAAAGPAQEKHAAAARADCPGTLLTARGRGPEGFAPLWTGIATRHQGRAAIRALRDSKEFATPLPFPTLSRSAADFDPKGYWRGRVWLDQYDFALRALASQGSAREADRFCRQLVQQADGLAGTAPVHENYNPLDGTRQGASNFSWSAAHLLLMLQRFRCQ